MAGQHGPVIDGVGTEDDPASRPSPRRHRTSRSRRIVRVAVTLVVVASLLFAGGAWCLSGAIGSGALHVSPLETSAQARPPDVVVTGAGPGWVELEPTRSIAEDLTGSNRYGLEWSTGFGWLRRPLRTSAEGTRRSLQVLSGATPTVGTTARVVRDAYPLDPGLLLGFPLRDVTYRSPAGVFPAYLADGTEDTWAILVHGRGATRAESFRLMRVTVGLGLPSLDIAYRHDPETGGGQASFGQTEWADLQAAARWAVRHGARHLVLTGTSMGGAITAAFLERSALADRVVAVVLDAPALDFASMIHFYAHGQSPPIPDLLTSAAIRVAALRYGLNLDQVDYLDSTAWVTAPVLAFHGSADPKIPQSTLERLAAAEPDVVTRVEVPGAGHVESWNADPRAYERQVRRFLAPLTR